MSKLEKRKNYLIKELNDFFNSTGEIPAYRSYLKYPELIGPGSKYAKVFGTFNNALKEAGLETFYQTDELGTISKNSSRGGKPLTKCKHCNKIFKNKYNSTFCTRTCFNEYRVTNFSSIWRKKSTTMKYNLPDTNTDAVNKLEQYIETNGKKCIVCNKKHLNEKFCSRECFNTNKRNDSLDKFNKGELLSNDACRKHLSSMHGYKCSECSISDWNGKPIVLEIDHIDGNPDNTMPNNLQLLCPNCHSQTPTFRRKNHDGPKSDRRSKARRRRYQEG